MDCANNPKIEFIVFMKSAQVGATESLINLIGYYADYDPSPIMMVQPILAMAETVSKDRITPLFRDTPSLAAKLSPKLRDKGIYRSQ